MTFRHTSEFVVEFGDCDPAQIVYYPNYFRWMDAASRRFFVAAGVPPWPELEAKTGIIGIPLVDASARFLRSATYGDHLSVETAIAEWRARTFVMAHVVRRGSDVLVEGQEVRIFARRHPDDPKRIQMVSPPEDVRHLFD
jgi:4-hydroxybenzoyl-CoA thioesterase